MRLHPLLLLVLALPACAPRMQVPARPVTAVTGSEFYRRVAAMNGMQRDSLALQEIVSGNLPPFLKRLRPVKLRHTDSLSGKRYRAKAYVMPDYLAIGSADDWARIPLTPMTAQRVADLFQGFLPTRKLSDAIYRQAKRQLEPVPLYAFRDSSPSFWHHHLIIEGQRRGRRGLIAGIKKDVVLSGIVTRHVKPDRVAIYGWHLPGGKPIQPLYAGHVNRYVDYSHGIRLISRRIRVNGRWKAFSVLMADPRLAPLLCDEPHCDFIRYPLLP